MIYLDNAATTFPKPIRVIRETQKCIRDYCGNPGRSSHSLSIKTSEKIYETRENIAKLLGIESKSERIVFTQNATYALNIAIKTSVEPQSHVLISDIEHNSVLRPIENMCKGGAIEYSVFKHDELESSIASNMRPNTKCIISTLASNVTGAEIPINRLSAIAKKHGLMLIVDASQTIGHKDINLRMTPCDILCAPGHKALFGIQGCGFVVFNDDRVRETLIEGGSGNESINKEMPQKLPERFEAGTLPSPAIVALNEGVKYVSAIGLDRISQKTDGLIMRLYDCLSSLNAVKIYGSGNGILSFNIENLPSSFVADELNRKNICVRAGLHCAPAAHKLLKTIDGGTVRVSVSYLNSSNDIDALYKSVKEICNRI